MVETCSVVSGADAEVSIMVAVLSWGCIKS